MQQERRNHPRFAVDGIKAHVKIERPAKDTLEFEGDVIDLSYSGIKIHMDSPLPEESEGWISIVLILPNSQIPVTIRGEIKHFCPDTSYGMQYDNNFQPDTYNDLLFECVKSVQRIT